YGFWLQLKQARHGIDESERHCDTQKHVERAPPSAFKANEGTLRNPCTGGKLSLREVSGQPVSPESITKLLSDLISSGQAKVQYIDPYMLFRYLIFNILAFMIALFRHLTGERKGAMVLGA